MKNRLERLERREMLNAATAGPCTCPFCATPSVNTGRDPGGDYQIGGRWGNTASGFTGATGNPATITWSIVNDGLSIPGFNNEPTSPSNLVQRLNAKYGSQAVWLPLFQSVFDRWSAVTGLTYIYEPSDDGAPFGNASGQLGVRGDVRISGHNIDNGFNVLAYNFYPGDFEGGDMVIDTTEFVSGAFVSTANNSRTFRNTLAHEHGHGMGLAHVIPGNNTKLMEPSLSTAFDGPQYDDILAAQSLYGDPLEKGGRNENANTASNLGTLNLGSNQTLVQQVSIANLADKDYFKFTVGNGTSVAFTLQPDGATYQQGPQNGSSSSFNSAAAGNLNLTFYDTNGTSILQTSATNAAGVAEAISTAPLLAGTYYVQVSMSAGTTQMYKLLANVSSGVAAPGVPDLASGSDTGLSNTDDITADTTPTLQGSATPNAVIRLFEGDNQIGNTNANANGSWSFTLDPLADGVYAITARSVDGANLSAPSPTLTLTIDTVGPSLVSTSYDRELTQRVALVFTDAIATQITATEVTVTNTTTSSSQNAFSVIYSAGNTTVTARLAATLLTNGRYTVTLPTSAATDVAGNALAGAVNFEFLQLAGDANGDAVVNFDDLLIVAQNYNSNSKTFSQGNLNYDGSGLVDFSDLLILAQNYGIGLVQSAPVSAKTASAKRRTNPADVLAY